MERTQELIPTLSSSSSTSPTTFVQADTHTFRDLVQKLTGAAEKSSDKLPITLPQRPFSRSSIDSVVSPRRSAFKLQERRQSMRKLEIKLGLTSLQKTHMLLSPTPSPVTPLGPDSCFLSSGSLSPATAAEEEEKVIAEKGFYLHPSPLSIPRNVSEPPELLTLFPLQSPKQQHRDL